MNLPIAYRWFLAKKITRWQPWYFVHTKETALTNPIVAENKSFAHAFKIETGADFDVCLFARRQDMDTVAFFILKNGAIEDNVITIHLSFAQKPELRAPLLYSAMQPAQSFTQWVRKVVISDVEDWISEEDMEDEHEL